MTRIEYGNIMLLHLLYFDKAVAELGGNDMSGHQTEESGQCLKSVAQSIVKEPERALGNRNLPEGV